MTQAMVGRTEQAVASLRKLKKEPPQAAFILGSGAQLLENLCDCHSLAYADAFGIAPGVAGHMGSISVGVVDGKQVAVLRGRFHLYEGHDWDIVSMATIALAAWGVPRLFVTNAAGGINSSFKVGDLMVIDGFVDMLNPKFRETGLMPALKTGRIDARNELTALVSKVGAQLSASDKSFRPMRNGVYAGMLGPSYETLSEIQMLKQIGADAVGMSTIPELEAASATKMQAAAISIITNVWSPDVALGGHEEVLEAAKEASTRLDKLFHALLAAI
jgi:purine-nucleoside phosphorylase